VLRVLLGIAVALAATYLLLLAVLLVSRPKGGLLQEAVRLLPDTLRLLHRLARDRTLPRGVRVRLWLLLVYLASPIDLVPDFLPVVGYADDVVVVVLTLRSVVHRAGPDALGRHWPGTPDGLAALWRLAGLQEGRRPDPRSGPAAPADQDDSAEQQDGGSGQADRQPGAGQGPPRGRGARRRTDC